MSDILELESNTISQTCVVYYLQTYLKIISIIIITRAHALLEIRGLFFFFPIKTICFETACLPIIINIYIKCTYFGVL